MNGSVDLVSVEGQHEAGLGGRRGERGAIELLIALVDGLTQRNPGEGDKIWIDGRVHQNNASGMIPNLSVQNRRDLLLKRPPRFDVLDALDVGQWMLTQHLSSIEHEY